VPTVPVKQLSYVVKAEYSLGVVSYANESSQMQKLAETKFNV
jgi:hypothetical protein